MPVRFLTLPSAVRCLLVVLTVMSSNGEIIDCISIAKQPAFDHPMLKNLTIQMTPSSYPHEVLAKENNASAPSNDDEQPENIVHPWKSVGGCPENTIPIKRITKEDLLRVDDIKNYGKKSNISHPRQFYHPTDISVDNGHEYAITYVNGGPYRGTKTQINVWKPRIEAGETSISQIWIIGGKFGPGLNTIEAGSHVNPTLYGDDNPRLFIYWTDPKTGNWWLQLNEKELIGYWPKELFTSLADEGASTIEWGGEVVNTKKDGQHTTTEMGSGHFPSEGFGKASSFDVIKIIDMNDGIIDPVGVQTLVSRPTCYDLKTVFFKFEYHLWALVMDGNMSGVGKTVYIELS
ncbi:hypothetical protein HA466_0096940 [Hirschfeldia incana]|nr:hypothetical protein HA466_0096940 [Hirschfeldia incana]